MTYHKLPTDLASTSLPSITREFVMIMTYIIASLGCIYFSWATQVHPFLDCPQFTAAPGTDVAMVVPVRIIPSWDPFATQLSCLVDRRLYNLEKITGSEEDFSIVNKSFSYDLWSGEMLTKIPNGQTIVRLRVSCGFNLFTWSCPLTHRLATVDA